MINNSTPGEAALKEKVLARIPATLRAQFEAVIGASEWFSDYWAMVETAIDTLKPKDIFEYIHLKDYVALEWDVIRYRQLRNAIIALCREEGVESMLKQLLDDSDQSEEKVAEQAERLKLSWRTDPKVLALLSQSGINPDHFVNNYASERIPMEAADIEFFDKRIADAERRRNVTLNEIKKGRERDARLNDVLRRTELRRSRF